MSKLRSLLVIDDDRDDFELIAEAVQSIDPDISVSFLQRCLDDHAHQYQSFDLIFLDINMPLHNGFWWLKGIRENGYERLPIVMYTNSLRPDHITEAYAGGANLYFVKPTSYKELINGMEKLINLDWTDPFSITKQYCHNGKYSIFKVA